MSPKSARLSVVKLNIYIVTERNSGNYILQLLYIYSYDRDGCTGRALIVACGRARRPESKTGGLSGDPLRLRLKYTPNSMSFERVGHMLIIIGAYSDVFRPVA